MANQEILDQIGKWFGDSYRDRDTRLKSYDFLEDHIEGAHLDWSRSPPTEKIATAFADQVTKLSSQEFAFLLCHSGFIPETYGADSSQETLFSKLVEVLVGEWALRLGFTKTTLPTKKASIEDVTISDDEHVIVCDAKTYRLGRSQKAPNVKDTLKQGDIAKWLSQYPAKMRLGGLVTFPSQHDWSGGSDVYLYLTDKSSPILMLFYEHLSFMSLGHCTKARLVSYYERHADLHPNPISTKQGNRKHYFGIINAELLACEGELWKRFDAVSNFIIRERVSHAIEKLQSHLAEIKKAAEAEVDALDEAQLKQLLIEARVAIRSNNLVRQMQNIRSFRSTLD